MGKLFLFLLLIGYTTITCQPYDISKYDLGNNLMENSDFELPDFSTITTEFWGGIPGWTCNPKC